MNAAPAFVLSGIQAVFIALLLIRSPSADTEGFTASGAFHFRPEYDLLVCFGGFAVVVLLIGALPRLARAGIAPPGRGQLLSAGVSLWVCSTSTALFLAVFLRARGLRLNETPLPASHLIVLATCALVLLGWGGLLYRYGALDQHQPTAEGSILDFSAIPLKFSPADAVAAALIFLVVYIPGYREIAAAAYLHDRFFHWDFFAMGPALALKHGHSLVAEAYSFYGFGWPVLFTKLDSFLPLSYPNMIRSGLVFAVVYFTGVYLLLRLVVGRVLWAAAGTVFAVLVQVYSGIHPDLSLWQFPSLTIMRRPLDVWFFIPLFLHARSPKTRWLAAAGSLAGLALFVEIDTGLHLLAVFGLYCSCLLVGKSRRARHAGQVVCALTTCLVAGGAAFILAAGTEVISVAFWKGWLEPVALAAKGYSLLPLVADKQSYVSGHPPTDPVFLLFFLISFLCLLYLARLLIDLVGGRTNFPVLFAGCLAAYGLLSTTQFIGRSDSWNLFHGAVPFVVLSTMKLQELATKLREGPKHGESVSILSWLADKGPSLAAVSAGVALLLSNAVFRNTPTALATITGTGPQRSTCKADRLKNVCLLGAGRTPATDELKTAAHVLRRLKKNSPQARIAILDSMGPAIYLEADVNPWGRYQPSFPHLLSRQRVNEVKESLVEDLPEFVLIRGPRNREPFFEDIWQEVHAVVQNEYQLDFVAAPFEIWRAAAD